MLGRGRRALGLPDDSSQCPSLVLRGDTLVTGCPLPQGAVTVINGDRLRQQTRRATWEESMQPEQSVNVARLIDERPLTAFNIVFVAFSFLIVLSDGYDI